MEKTETLSRFEWNKPKIPVALPHGEDAAALYQAQREVLENQLGNNKYAGVLKYNSQKKEMTGSNVFATGLVNMALRDSGLRTAVPSDDRDGDVLKAIQDKYYADFNALGVREKQPGYEKNNGLWKKVVELAEETQGSVKFPFMVEGFYTAPLPEDTTGYGLTIVPAPNFRVIHDKRLSGKYNRQRFTHVDEIGLPDFDKNGSRTFYSIDDGLSRFYLYWDSDVVSNGGNLAGSNDNGRVVLVKEGGNE